MTELIRSWLIAVLTAGILSSVADTLMPEGAVKRVGKLTCGLIMICALLFPLGSRGVWDYEALGGYWEELLQGKELLKGQVDEQMKEIIERECAAYIVDKAAETGAVCTAEVECTVTEDGIYLPERVRISGQFEAAQRSRLSEQIEQELGVPVQRQHFTGGEEGP